MSETTVLTCPEDYTEYDGDDVMTNFDHTIEETIAEQLQAEPLYAHYAGYNFNGVVWWDRERTQWCCAVWQYHVHRETVTAETLEEIMQQVSDRYGWD